MANISNKERKVKSQCLDDAFEKLKQKSYNSGKNFISKKSIIELANQDVRMKEFKKTIGDKSIYTKAKNSIYKDIVEKINTWESNYKLEAKMADNTSKNKLKNMQIKLEDCESYLIELQEEILRLNKIIENKENIITNIENDRELYASQLALLRKDS